VSSARSASSGLHQSLYCQWYRPKGFSMQPPTPACRRVKIGRSEALSPVSCPAIPALILAIRQLRVCVASTLRIWGSDVRIVPGAPAIILQVSWIFKVALNGPRLKFPFSLGFSLGNFLECEVSLMASWLLLRCAPSFATGLTTSPSQANTRPPMVPSSMVRTPDCASISAAIPASFGAFALGSAVESLRTTEQPRTRSV